MSNPVSKIFIGVVGLVAVAALVWIVISRTASHSEIGASLPVGDVGSAPVMGVVVNRSADGTQVVSSVSGDYRASVPANWKVEPIGAGDVAVYPRDTASSSLACKIELYVFDNTNGQTLEAWIAAAMREDPTVTVRQTSLEAIAVGGGRGVRWTGLADGMSVTLVYAMSGNKIYEFTPSSLDPNDMKAVSCAKYIDTFLSSVQFSG